MLMTALLILTIAVVIGGYLVWTTFTKPEPSRQAKQEPYHKLSEAINAEAAEELHPFEKNKEVDLGQKTGSSATPLKQVDVSSNLPDETALTIEQQLAKLQESEYEFQANVFDDLKNQLAQFQNTMDQINTQLKEIKLLNEIANGFVNYPLTGSSEYMKSNQSS